MENEIILAKIKRIGYGAAEMGVSSTEVMLRVSLLIFYTNHVGLNPKLAGYALAIGLLWDAIIDPIFGKYSDDFSFKGQRRRPFFLPGAIGLATFIVLLFNNPVLESQSEKFFYLLFCYLGTNTFMSILSLPHTALAGDIVQDKNQRTELFGWKLLFGNIGLIIGTSFPALILFFSKLSGSPDSTTSYAVALVIFIGTFISYLSTKNLDNAPLKNFEFKKRINYLLTIKHVIKNKSFINLLFAYMLATVALTLNSSLSLYYYKYFLKFNDAQVRSVFAFFLLIFSISIPFWVYISRFFSKKNLIIKSIFVLGLITTIGYPLFPAKMIFYPLVIGLLAGILVGSIVLMDVLVAEYSDKEAIKHNESYSNIGLYFGIWKMTAKFSRAFSLILTGYLLSWIGFVPQENPGELTSYYISIIFGPVVGIILIISTIILFLSKETNE